jgi:glycosyltransferase involved in cell wall biosynthesis
MAVARTPTLARLPSRVVYNGYDVDRWRPDPGAGAEFRARHGLSPDGLVVVTVSALERAKGQDVALQALEEVQRGGTPITYVLVGDGKHAAQIRARALHSPVATVFTGFLHGADIIGALNAADLYLHPAREEIFPNAVAEAMACGRAVVATEIGGMSELLGPDGGAGLLVPPDRPDVMADAIRRCIADAELRARLGVAGRRRIETRFPVPSMVDGYERALFAALDPVAR